MIGRPSVTFTPPWKSRVLRGDQRLVVIHADGRIVSFPRFGMEQGIGRGRTEHVDPLIAQCRHGGRDHLALFPAETAAFAGMGIEGGDSQAGAADGLASAQIIDRDPRGMEDIFTGQPVDCFPEREMDRDRHHAQAGRLQHHHGPDHSRQVAEEFRLSGPGKPRFIQRLLVDGIGHDGCDRARPGGRDRAAKRVRDGLAGGPVGLAGLRRRGQGLDHDGKRVRQDASGFLGRVYRSYRDGQSQESRSPGQIVGIVKGHEGRQLGPVAPGGQGELGADTGWVPHGQRQGKGGDGHTRTSRKADWRRSRR